MKRYYKLTLLFLNFNTLFHVIKRLKLVTNQLTVYLDFVFLTNGLFNPEFVWDFAYFVYGFF